VLVELLKRTLLLWACVTLCCSARVRADAPNQAETIAEYAEVLQHGVDAFSAGHWAEARLLFERAHHITPTARTLRGLALCDFELGHYLAAISECQASLDDPRRPLTPELRAQIEETLSRARHNVGHLQLTLPDDASELRVDGASMPIPADGEVSLDPGQHTLEVSLPDAEPIARTFTLEVGAREHLIFAGRLAARPQLPAPAVASEPAVAPPPPPPLTAADQPATSAWTRPYVWAALGVSALFAAGIVGFGLAASSEHSAFSSEYRSYQLQRAAGMAATAPSGAHRSAGKRWQALTNISIVGCASSAIIAGALLLAGQRSQQSEAPLVWSVGVGPSSATAAVSVRAF
jgi:hypothetical protein